MFKLSFGVLGLFHFVRVFFLSALPMHSFFPFLAFLAAVWEQHSFLLRYL